MMKPQAETGKTCSLGSDEGNKCFSPRCACPYPVYPLYCTSSAFTGWEQVKAEPSAALKPSYGNKAVASLVLNGTSFLVLHARNSPVR